MPFCKKCGYPLEYECDEGHQYLQDCPFCKSYESIPRGTNQLLRIRNSTGYDIGVYLRYRYVHRGEEEVLISPTKGYEKQYVEKPVWYPQENWLHYNFSNGEISSLLDDGWTIQADMIRIWAESTRGRYVWEKYKNVALRIGEVNEQKKTFIHIFN